MFWWGADIGRGLARSLLCPGWWWKELLSFYRYSYSMEREGAGVGSWEQLRPILRPVRAGGALAWIPRLDSLGEYPMGQVFALAGECCQPNQSSYLYSYNPNTDTWRTEYTFPYDVVIDSGAAMAPGVPALTGNYYDVRIFPGGHSTAYLVWKPSRRTLRYNHQTQNSGAALCEGETAYSCYAVFGEDNWDHFEWHRLDSVYEGAQGRVSGIPNPLRVKTLAGAGEYRFTISCAPGPVSLKVIDVLGRDVVKTIAQAGSAGVDLNWRYRSFSSGVYFYKVETPSGSTSNKLVVAK